MAIIKKLSNKKTTSPSVTSIKKTTTIVKTDKEPAKTTTTTKTAAPKKVNKPVVNKQPVVAAAPEVIDVAKEYRKFNTVITNIGITLIASAPGATRQMVKVIDKDTVKVKLVSTNNGVKITYTVNEVEKLSKEFIDPKVLKEEISKL